jgi:hypothetical protein
MDSMSRRGTHRETRPAGTTGTPAEPTLSGPVEAVSNSARFDLSFCVLGVVLIVCAMLLTFRFAMSPANARFLGMGDCWTYYGPTLSFLDHAIHEDRELPLWNPLYFCGQPHAANPQSFVFYPPNLLRSLLTFNPTPLRTHAGIALMVLAQTVVAGIGALLLARRHGYSYGAALLAAFAFPFSGALVSRAIGHWIFLNSTCWLPWVLLCANTMVHGRGLFRRGAAAAWTGLLYGFCILGGVPVLTFMGGLLLGAYWLLETLGGAVLAARGDCGTMHGPRWKPVFRTLLTGGALFAAVVIVSGMLAAPLLLPLVEFARQTGRAAAVAGVEDIAPLAYGWTLAKTLVFYEGHGSYEGIRGGGAAVMAFSLLALLLKPRWNGLRWAVLFALVLDLSVSEPLLFGRLIRAVAPFISNDPGRGMAVGCLPLAMLAGWGLDAVMQSSATLRRRMAITALVISVGGAVLTVLAFAVPPGYHPVPPVAVALPAMALAAALMGLWLREHLLTGIVAAMLLLGEILAWNGVLLPDMMKGEILYQGSLERLASKKGYSLENRRITDRKPNTRLYDLQFIMNGYDPLHLLATRGVITPVLAPTDKFLIRSIEEQEPAALSQRGNLFLKRRFWLAREYCPGPLPGHGRLFPPARVVFLPGAGDIPVPAVAMDRIPETGLSEKENETSLLGNGHPLLIKREMMKDPGVTATIGEAAPGGRHGSLFLTLVGQGRVRFVPVFKNVATGDMQLGLQRDATLKTGEPQTLEFPMPDSDRVQVYLRVDFFESAQEVLVTTASVATDAGDEKDHVRIVRQTANQTDLRLSDLSGPRVLLFVDSFYPGWKAAVDGKEVPILRANDAFKAIVVPAGSSEVRFTFSSARITVGLVLAGMAVILVVLATAAQILEGRRGAVPPPISPPPGP